MGEGMVNLTSLGFLSQILLLGVLFSTSLFFGKDDNAFFTERAKESSLRRKINRFISILMGLIMIITFFSMDTISGVNPGLNDDNALDGISREWALGLYLIVDVVFISLLVGVTGGPTVSPFKSCFSLVPVFALFLGMSDSGIYLLIIYISLFLLGFYIYKRHPENETILEHQSAELCCNILTIVVAVWIGIATRGI